MATILFITDKFSTDEKLDELKAIFHALDLDGDGTLTKSEIKHSTLITQDQINELFPFTDIDGDGEVTYDEWIVTFIDKNKLITDENLLLTVFKFFDHDGGNSVSASELKTELGKMFPEKQDFSEVEWKEIINEVDQDGNGSVEFDEFKKMMRKCLA